MCHPVLALLLRYLVQIESYSRDVGDEEDDDDGEEDEGQTVILVELVLVCCCRVGAHHLATFPGTESTF